ncbi:PAS domain-containing protein [Rhizobium sp. S152]|uniref:PAS domain-containing protein n=1 Tax=Rhizobium sp. S152 TaxID=3055038 RepID=UPI0025A9404E|nr:PAS domain-containing protein [Rhizobium sp. S152]MDM9628388.1 PAS domain-containing protein [Rhizobium sp. S152]
MLELFQAFSLRCGEIDDAIRIGDDTRVSVLDRSIGALIDAIVAYRAKNLVEIHMQLQFVGCLIDQYAEDSESVREHVKLLAYLMEQYFGGALPDMRALPVMRDVISMPLAYVPKTDNGNFLNAAILDSLPDRVAVLTKDYRYLYSNELNAVYLGRKPIELVGRHIVDFVGEERFLAEVKSRLDACFAGMHVDYRPDGAQIDPREPIRCRMSPLRDSHGEILGALIVTQGKLASSATIMAA